MILYPKAFFELQLTFAQRLAELENISLSQALFEYTSVYARTVGFSHTEAPDSNHSTWVALLADLPSAVQDQAEYLYQAHVQYETSAQAAAQSSQFPQFGCFSYVYDPTTNAYGLHFTNNDPQGNLGRDRVPARLAELKDMAEALKKAPHQPQPTVKATSWLLSIEAFRRLLPPAIVATAVPRNKGRTQDNGWWGQFVDRYGQFRQDLGQQLMANTQQRQPLVDDYFPIRTLKITAPLSEFIDFYC